jgi:hypothetical protein
MTTIGGNIANSGVGGLSNIDRSAANPSSIGNNPVRASRADPASVPRTIAKPAAGGPGSIPFGGKMYHAAMVAEVNLMRSNPAKYAKIMKAHVESNPSKFSNQGTPVFDAALKSAVKTMKKLGSPAEKGQSVLKPLNFNKERSKIAQTGVEFLAARGEAKLAASGISVERGDDEYLTNFLDHEPIRHLRLGGEKDGVSFKGTDNVIGELRKTEGGADLHRSDLENLSAFPSDSLTVRDVLVDWLIDDGVDGAGHRHALLNNYVSEIGVGSATATVMDKSGQPIEVKMTNLNFFGIVNTKTNEFIQNPAVR